MAGRRIPEAEYVSILNDLRAVVEQICRDTAGLASYSEVQRRTGWNGSTTHNRLAGAVERGLLRFHDGIAAYSPAVDAEGRPMRLVLMVEEAEPKTA